MRIMYLHDEQAKKGKKADNNFKDPEKNTVYTWIQDFSRKSSTSFWQYPAGEYPCQPAGTLIRRIRLKVLFGKL